MTQHADLVIDADEAAVVQLARALDAEFYVSEDAARLRRMFNLIHLDTGFKIDLVIKKSRRFSVEELRRREAGALAGRQVDFATAEDSSSPLCLSPPRFAGSLRRFSSRRTTVSTCESARPGPPQSRWPATRNACTKEPGTTRSRALAR